MNYPNGQKKAVNQHQMPKQSNKIYSNRGMSLEEDINITNQYYLDMDKAVIHKKPTPVQIVKVNYPSRSAAVITEAYFKQASTTDYNGLYRGKYVDFEAKETKNKTVFPLTNVHEHQLKHMKSIVNHGGISFIIIRFSIYEETFLLPAEKLFEYWNDKLKGGMKSIPYKEIKEQGYMIPLQYQARVDYLSVMDQIYFS
ncbi:Holliday junction resolvase RecU [Oceanobacillus salinisoli]|uniref:Holliday junction resolvase RecU n=1 Tax=Oceanobacillus salinisoli TaxID=2678611 RepID=UPI0012E2F805|nr:Holliday junction resolvase RecU [Oceanobacillus salinisoli]